MIASIAKLMVSIRWWWHPLLPVLGAMVLLAGLACGLDVWLCTYDWVARWYNASALWLVARYHDSEWQAACLLFSVLVLLDGRQRYHGNARRGLGRRLIAWGAQAGLCFTAGYFAVLWPLSRFSLSLSVPPPTLVLLLVLLLSWACLLRPARRCPTWLGGCVRGAATAVLASSIVLATGLLWTWPSTHLVPWLCLLPLAFLIWVWVRGNWVYLLWRPPIASPAEGWTAVAWTTALFLSAGYLLAIWPWSRFSASLLPGWLLLWLVLRALLPRLSWLSAGVRRSIRQYWERSAGGHGYLDAMLRLRSLQQGRNLVWPKRLDNSADRKRCGWETLLQWCEGLRLAACLGRLTPKIPASLAADDVLLVSELEYLVESSWDAAERELYDAPDRGQGRRRPVDAATCRRLQQTFRRWQFVAESLTECYVFDAFAEPPPVLGSEGIEEDPQRARLVWSVCAATNLLSRHSRPLILPTLRAEARAEAEDLLPLFWWNGSLGDTFRLAERMLERELLALNWLLGRSLEAADRDGGRPVAGLCGRYSGQRNLKQLAALRLAFAHAVRQGLQLGSGRTSVVQQVISANMWEKLRDVIESDVRPMLFESPGISDELRAFAVATRYRYFDACWLNPEPQYRQLRAEVDACQNRWSEADEVLMRLDQWYAGQTHLQESWWFDRPLDQRRRSCHTAIEYFHRSRHCCAGTVRELLDPDQRDTVAGLSDETPSEPSPLLEPAYTADQLHGSWQHPLGRSREPNIFVRARLAWLWLALSITAAVAVHWTAAGPVALAPDLRLGGRHMHEEISAITPGLETDEPSVWIATAGGGVHVKGGGSNHHWSQWTAENTGRAGSPGLPSDHVLSVDLDPLRPLAAYLCQRGGRRVIGVSDYPTAAPGIRPWTYPRAWATFLGDSRFADVGDGDLTVVLQPRGCPLMLVGSQDAGLGRYHVAERRWLDRVNLASGERHVTINRANGFLKPGQRTISSVDAIETDEGWVATVATNDGIAGGPIWHNRRSPQPEAEIRPEDWFQVGGDQLLDPQVVRVRLRRDAETNVVDYRTAGQGLGTLRHADGTFRSHQVRVGQAGVERLSAETLRRVVYSESGQRIWTVDAPDSAAGERISVYRERSHDWRTEPRPTAARRVFDVVVDPRRNEAVLAGTENGLASLADDFRAGGAPLDIQQHGPDQAAVRQVLASAKEAVVWARKDGDPHSGVYALGRAANGRFAPAGEADWRTIVGSGSFDEPELSLAQITTVRSVTDGRSLYFGTQRWGIGYIDASARDIRRPFRPGVLRDRHVRDLCVLPDAGGFRDRYLLQVTGDYRIDCIDLEPSERTTVFGAPGPRFGTDLCTAAVHENALYLGVSGGVARYEMHAHQWSRLQPLPRLAELAVAGRDSDRRPPAAGRLWARTRTDSGTLHVLDADRATWSEPRLQDVRAFDPAPQHLVAATHRGGLYVVEPAGPNRAVLEPQSLESTAEPTAAAVGGAIGDDDLHLAMGERVASFSFADHHWANVANPSGRRVDNLFANRDGLWLLDDLGRLYRAGSDDPVAEQVEVVNWDEDGAVLLHTHGGVTYVTGKEPGILVGTPWNVDVRRETTAVQGFGNDLFVAVGDQVGRYRFSTHSWTNATPPKASSLRQLVAAGRHLFALDSLGQLFLLPSPSANQWTVLNRVFVEACAQVAGSFAAGAAEPRVAWIGPVGQDLAVVVRDAGTFRLPDANPEQPQWLLGRSQGPPGDVEVTCAAEGRDTLYLGTAGHGVWVYAPVPGGSRGSAMLWQQALPDETIVKLISLADDPLQFAALTATSVIVANRTEAGSWNDGRQVNRGDARDVAASGDELYWIEAGWGGRSDRRAATHLYYLPAPYEDVSPIELVGSAAPSRATTYSVAAVPGRPSVLRADTQGQVARYDWETHRWNAETVGDGSPSALELCTLGDVVWAWNSKDRRLFRREGEDAWRPFRHRGTELAVSQFVHDDAGMLLLAARGAVLYAAADESIATVVPASSAGPEVNWQDGVLAELGDWLLVSDEQSLRAYHQKLRQWKEILPVPVHSFEQASTPAGQPCFYARGRDGREIWYITESGSELKAEPVAFPAQPVPPAAQGSPPEADVSLVPVRDRPDVPRFSGWAVAVFLVSFMLALALFAGAAVLRKIAAEMALVVAVLGLVFLIVAVSVAYRSGAAWLVRSGEEEEGLAASRTALVRLESDAETRLLARSPDGAIYELRHGTVVGMPLVRPVAWQESESPQITAAAEWQELLFLGYCTAPDRGGIAVYDPLRLAWQRIDVDSEQVLRFWPLDSSLFVETRQRVSDEAGPAKAIWEVTLDETKSWACRKRIDAIYDVASDGLRLWLVNAQQRLESYPAGADTSEQEVLGLDAVSGSIRATVPIDDELVVLLDDGAVWHYSLEQFRWERKLAGKPCLDLFLVHGNLLALFVSADLQQRDYWHYAEGPAGRDWKPLALPGTGAVEFPAAPRDTSRDRWQVTSDGNERRFGWRLAEAGEFRPVALETEGPENRFAFNRYSRIVWHDGVLWCETLALGQPGRLCRRFATGPHGLERELDAGDVRSQRSLEHAVWEEPTAALLTVDGRVFAVGISAGGPWPLFDRSGGLQVKLKQSGAEAIPVVLVPVADGWSLDLDDWGEIVAYQGLLHAATRSGILAVAIDGDNGTIRRVAYQPCPHPIRFVRRGEELFARAADGVFYQFDTAAQLWRQVVEPGLRDLLHRENKAVRSNQHLRNWRVTDAGSIQLQRRIGDSPDGSRFVTVSLDQHGFGFDRVLGVGLDASRIILYGPDGRLCYRRDAPRDDPIELDSQYRLRDGARNNSPYRAARHPKHGTVLLNASSAYRFADGDWVPLPRDTVSAVRAELREPLAVGHGWEWRSDDSVTVALPPFEAAPLAGRFDGESGQFSFDRLFALQAQGEELMAATGAGVLNWRGQRLAAAELLPKLEHDEPAVVRFFRGENDAWLLHFGFQTGGSAVRDRLFRRRSPWQEVADPREVQAILAEGAAALHQGPRWSLAWSGGGSQGPALRRLDKLKISRDFGDGAAHQVELLRRQWTFEDVACACWADNRIVCGTEAGMLDLRGPRWHPTNFSVRRLAAEGDRVHAGLSEGSEQWHGAADLARQVYRGTPFAELDQILFEDKRWQWRRGIDPNDGSASLQVKVSLVAGSTEKRDTHFAAGRFDFDRVEAVGCDAGEIVLATAGGFLVRRPGGDGSSSKASPAGLARAARKAVFSVWRDGARRLYVEGAPGQVFSHADGWTRLSATDTADVLQLRAEQVARNHRWNVTRGDRGLEFRISTGPHADQPVEFLAQQGRFSFDLVNDVLLAPDGRQLFVATRGGLLRYALDGKLVDLRSDFDGPDVPAAFNQLERTGSGPLTLAASGDAYRWSGKGWDRVDPSHARQAIDAEARWIHCDAGGWQVERVSAIDHLDSFRFVWQDQPLHLESLSGSLAFRHDLAQSAEWHSNCVWVATRGGVLRLVWSDGRLIAPADGLHLWTKPFLEQIPVLIRKHPVESQAVAETLVCRTRSPSGGEQPMALLPFGDGTATWQPVPHGERFRVLHPDDGLWEWRLRSEGGMQIVPNTAVFTLPDSGRYEYFRGGRIAFWDVAAEGGAAGGARPPEGTPLPAPLAFRERLFVATAGGVLGLSASGHETRRIYAADADGAPLQDVTDLGFDLRTPDKLYARAGSRVYRYESERDVWQLVQHPFPERAHTVECAWLTFEHPAPQRAVPKFAAGVSDSPGPPGGVPLLADGRFAFDRVNDFVWTKGEADKAEGWYWLLTPLGIIRLDPQNGEIQHFSAGWAGDVSQLESLHLAEERGRERLYVCGHAARVWQEQGPGKWTAVPSSEPVYDRLRTVVDNAMLKCRRLDERRYEFELAGFASEAPAFRNAPQTPPLLQDGIFLFDDLRDLRMAGDALLVAARDGVWEYDLRAIRSLIEPVRSGQKQSALARIPTRAVFHAADGSGNSLALTGLDCFAGAWPDAPLRLLGGDPGVEFLLRHDGTWQTQARISAEANKRLDLPDPNEDVVWRLELGTSPDGDRLTVQRLHPDGSSLTTQYVLPPPGKVSMDQADVIQTRSSLWIALPNNLLWVRKSEFQEGWWASRGRCRWHSAGHSSEAMER